MYRRQFTAKSDPINCDECLQGTMKQFISSAAHGCNLIMFIGPGTYWPAVGKLHFTESFLDVTRTVRWHLKGAILKIQFSSESYFANFVTNDEGELYYVEDDCVVRVENFDCETSPIQKTNRLPYPVALFYTATDLDAE